MLGKLSNWRLGTESLAGRRYAETTHMKAKHTTKHQPCSKAHSYEHVFWFIVLEINKYDEGIMLCTALDQIM